MDVSRFQQDAPGDLVEIENNEKAFVPHALPPAKWVIGASTWQLLVEAMHELGRLDGIAINLPNPGILLRPLENREALRSSSLEGTYATPKELLLFDMPDAAEKSLHAVQSERINAWQEVLNYRRALTESSEASVADAPLHLIRQLHAVLLTGVRGSDRTPGRFRTGQVFIGREHRFIPPPPTAVLECLEQFEAFIKNQNPAIPPLVRAFIAHYQFETIHPFMDGNGRVGRLLMALMIRDLCKHRKPWLYLSAFFDRHKDEYIDKLFAVSAQGDWRNWVEFCLQATLSQTKDTFERCNKLLTLREGYRSAVGDQRRLPRIVEMLFTNQFVRPSSLASELDVTYPTAQRDIDRLVELKILRELKGSYPKLYVAMEIYDVAFWEPDGGAPSFDE